MRFAVLACVLSAGCYSTKLNVNSRAQPGGQMYESRQWFALWGAAPLSDPAQAGCEPTWVESEFSPADVVIAVGLGVAVGAVSYAVCSSDSVPACVTAGYALSGLLPLPRTMRWTCPPGQAQGAHALQAAPMTPGRPAQEDKLPLVRDPTMPKKRGQLEDCVRDEQCEGPLVCMAGKCLPDPRPPPPPLERARLKQNAACSADADCEQGLACLGSRCLPDPRVPPAPPPAPASDEPAPRKVAVPK